MDVLSEYYFPTDPVAIVPLEEYSEEGARVAIKSLLDGIGGLEFVNKGMRVVIKANLVSAMKPDAAATTHPMLISALCEMLVERGATVVVGDSPGGLYNSAFVGRVYNATGMKAAEKAGAKLNADFSELRAEFPKGKVLRDFVYTGYLKDADVIINFCKLKSHGMMGMSCAAKNMFGAIPGVIKPEYHFRFPKYEDFADMIVDLDEYFHPVISIADAVVGMEGNGPTAGVPRKMGFLLASRSPHTLDMVAANLIGFKREELPILDAAYRRGLIPDKVEDVKIIGSIQGLRVDGFERVVERRSLEFSGDGKNIFKRTFSKIAAALLRTRPYLKSDACVGCGVCEGVCPAKAIVIKNKKAKINRKSCIRCFCCQEFCPKSALKVKRTFIANMFHREKNNG
ncbi:MAG: DUF362 domain-containing protein [Ruminococcaceae bacterium]|nr:DUF362 domain-containing protein [Oscillospiraceae bacterium]